MNKTSKQRKYGRRKGSRKSTTNKQVKDFQVIRIWKDLPPKIPRAPRGPHAGCLFTTRQLVATFNGSTGLTNSNQILQNSAVAVFGSFSFRHDDMAQSATFAALFDQYRFEEVLLRFYCRNNAASVFNIASPNNAVPTLYVVIDRDDATQPSLITDLRQYDNAESLNGTSSVDIRLKPSITPAVFASGAFSGYSVERSDQSWIDIANTSVPNYGVKWGIPGLTATTSSSWVWDVEAWYTVSYRNTR